MTTEIEKKAKRCDLAYEVFSLAVEDCELAINFTRMHDMLGGEFDDNPPDASEFVSSNESIRK